MDSPNKLMPLPDLIKFEGVIAKGFGLISKTVMSDPTVPAKAKAILLYFCSLSGKGGIFPGRDRILGDLQISKDTYYEGLKILKEKGYLKVQQERSGGQFFRNIYTIPAIVTLEGGYGVIPHAVMVDQRLSIYAKVSYGYISSYSGATNETILQPLILQYHLSISTSTQFRALKQLRDYNYLTSTQIKTDGRTTNYVRYLLTKNPDEANRKKATLASIDFLPNYTQKSQIKILNCPEQDTVEQDTVEILNCPEQDTAEQDTVEQDTVEQDTVKQDTMEKDTTNNSSLPVTVPTSTSFVPAPASTTISFVPALSGQMVAAITEKIHFNDLLRIYAKEPKTLQALSSLMEFIKEVYFNPQPLYKLKNETISDHYLRYLFDYYDIHVSVNHALEAFRSKANAVINQKAFMSACFLNHLYDLSSMFPMDGDMVLAMQLRFGNAEYYGNPDCASATKTS